MTNTPKKRAEYHKEYRKTYDRKQVKVLFTPEEYAELKMAANGKPLAGLVRKLAFARLRDTPNIPPLNENTAKELQRLIRAMSNNLNQVAHHVNASRLEIGSTYQPSEQMLAQMRDSLALLEQQVRALIAPSQEQQ